MKTQGETMKEVTPTLPGHFLGAHLMDEEEINEVLEVMRSKSIFRYYGPQLLGKTDQFEAELARFLEAEHVLAVSSGTAALKTALQALGIGPGDEVIVPAYGFIATANAVVACHAVPVFADIDESMNIDPGDVRTKITANTKAIICVHVQGVAAELESLLDLANGHGIPLIEDAAQAFGGTYKGRKLGTLGAAGCFSFQTNKIVSLGEGGAVAMRSSDMYQRAAIYHDQGCVRHDGFPTWNNDACFFGENYRMSELSAAIGRVQLRKSRILLKQLRELKAQLRHNLGAMGLHLRRVPDAEGDCGVAECFYVQDEQIRNEIIARLKSDNVLATPSYNSAVYENRMFYNRRVAHSSGSPFAHSQITYEPGMCPAAERLARLSVWIPVIPLYDMDKIETISEAVQHIMASY
ncbi:DegT/DnrJ/EryC1/StrS family aminotransferase [Paenibacillus ehimensis]|uniref:DegT/DnrJ/EryC1/StrS family aminotransferase n=1 Tax=Paenibacillus ehimensis TaxID=79264 RepID=A0ABT8V5T9_9BACL|nr:DegT/DnrJ/EryC1/StrS family aminotransferase [Paenibacillus ehimensis]MDO3676793.1 DegT/DnrJ/EryC1/StrS family aminotransferase [Paenibacillus ehimensis]